MGIIPGIVNGLIYATVITALLLALPISDRLSAKIKASRLAGTLIMPSEWVESKLSPVFDAAIKKTMNKLTVEPGSEESESLTFRVTNARVRDDLESRMLDMINEERRQNNLPPLVADPELTTVARAHARDMFSKSYFSHINPDGKGPFDRMREANVHFTFAGENLALAQTLEIAHNGLMNSPGHRANILNKNYHRVGIGILDGGAYGLMIAQEFRV